MTTIVKAVRTCIACPSQWDAWDSEGKYLYLRYRHARGTISREEGGIELTVIDRHDIDPQDGFITLEEFCSEAGIILDLKEYSEIGPGSDD